MPIKVPVTQTGLEQSIQNAANKAGKNLKINMGPGAKSVEGLIQPLGRLTGKADDFTKSMTAANARVLAFGASVGVVAAVTRGFKELVSTTIKVEKSLANINSILNQSNAQLESLKGTLFDVARNTETSFESVAQAALELSRQGLKAEEVTTRLNDALILSRLSGLSAADSVSGLTAAINSFSASGITSTEVLNKISAAAASAAVSDRDLIEGLKRSGSVAISTGVSFDELLGIISALQQKTARGGAVIGNSLKTIFTRLQDVDKLRSLQDLGVQVRDLEGDVLSANKIIENLAPVFDKLSQSSKVNLADNLVGKFQIAPFLSLLEDYNSEIVISNKQAQVSLNATNEAYKRNEALNETLSSAINKTSISLEELANKLGEIGVTDSFKNLVDFFGGLAEKISGVLDGDGIGSKLAKGLVKGISAIVTGPGLLLLLAIVAKLGKDFIAFGFNALKTFFGINKAAKEHAILQGQIAQALLNDSTLRREILRIENSSLSVEQKRKIQADALTGAYNAQLNVMRQMQSIAATITPSVMRGTQAARTGKTGRAAGGFLPIGAEKSDISRGVGGAPASAKPVVIPNFAFGGGKRGTMVANSSEYIVPNYANGGDAIFNQNMASSMGLPANARKVRAASGYVPNFAAIPEKINAKGKYVMMHGQKGGANPNATAYRHPDGKFNTINKKGAQAIRVPVYGLSDKHKGKDVDGFIKDLERYSYAKAIKEAKILSNDKMPTPVKKGSIKAKINKGSVASFAGGIYELVLATLLTDKEFLSYASQTDTSNFDLNLKGQSKLLNLYGIDTKPSFGEVKGRNNPDNVASAAAKIYRVAGLGESAQKSKLVGKKMPHDLAVKLGLKSPARKGIHIIKKSDLPKLNNSGKTFSTSGGVVSAAASGYIPNFAEGALENAIGREKAAGLPVSQIRINQSGKLRNSQNPMGLAVTNTRDEPTGAIPAARGFIPNLAKGKGGKKGKDDGGEKQGRDMLGIVFAVQAGLTGVAAATSGAKDGIGFFANALSGAAASATGFIFAGQGLKAATEGMSGPLGAVGRKMGAIGAMAGLAIGGLKLFKSVTHKLTGDAEMAAAATKKLGIAAEKAALILGKEEKEERGTEAKNALDKLLSTERETIGIMDVINDLTGHDVAPQYVPPAIAGFDAIFKGLDKSKFNPSQSFDRGDTFEGIINSVTLGAINTMDSIGMTKATASGLDIEGLDEKKVEILNKAFETGSVGGLRANEMIGLLKEIAKDGSLSGYETQQFSDRIFNRVTNASEMQAIRLENIDKDAGNLFAQSAGFVRGGRFGKSHELIDMSDGHYAESFDINKAIRRLEGSIDEKRLSNAEINRGTDDQYLAQAALRDDQMDKLKQRKKTIEDEERAVSSIKDKTDKFGNITGLNEDEELQLRKLISARIQKILKDRGQTPGKAKELADKITAEGRKGQEAEIKEQSTVDVEGIRSFYNTAVKINNESKIREAITKRTKDDTAEETKLKKKLLKATQDTSSSDISRSESIKKIEARLKSLNSLQDKNNKSISEFSKELNEMALEKTGDITLKGAEQIRNAFAGARLESEEFQKGVEGILNDYTLKAILDSGTKGIEGFEGAIQGLGGDFATVELGSKKLQTAMLKLLAILNTDAITNKDGLLQAIKDIGEGADSEAVIKKRNYEIGLPSALAQADLQSRKAEINRIKPEETQRRNTIRELQAPRLGAGEADSLRRAAEVDRLNVMQQQIEAQRKLALIERDRVEIGKKILIAHSEANDADKGAIDITRGYTELADVMNEMTLVSEAEKQLYKDQTAELENQTAEIEKQLKLKGISTANMLKQAQIDEKGHFGAGFDEAFYDNIETAEDSSAILGRTLGDASSMFAFNMANAMNDAIRKGESVGDALIGAATSFLTIISDALMQKSINDMLGGNFGTNVTSDSAPSGFLESTFAGVTGFLKSINPFQSGGAITGGSGTKDDVPAMLMGGEFVMNKKAVKKYGMGFMSSLNNGSIQGFASGGIAMPGFQGAGAITGRANLMSFATQTHDPGMQKLTMFGRRNNKIQEQYQAAKGQAFQLSVSETEARERAKREAEERKEALMDQLKGAVIGAAVSAGMSSMMKGASTAFKNSKAAGGGFFKNAASGLGGALFGAQGKIADGSMANVGGLKNLFTGNFSQALGVGKFQSYNAKTASATGPSATATASKSNDKNIFSSAFGGLKSLGSSAFGGLKSMFGFGGGQQGPVIGPFDRDGNYLEALADMTQPQIEKARGYATGGLIPASGGVDTVPAMLSGGEFVMNSAATQRIGADNLEAVNAGSSVDSGSTGLISKMEELIRATEQTSKVGEINITINGSSGEENQENSGEASRQQRELADKIKTVVKQVIVDEKRLGGQLRK